MDAEKDSPIRVPLGDDREIEIHPTNDPDTIKLYLHGKFTGSLVVVPRAGNAIVITAEVHGKVKMDATRA